MKSGKYKVIEERLLTKEEALKAMDFEAVLQRSALIKPSFFSKGSIFGSAIIIVSVILFFSVYKNNTPYESKLTVSKKESLVSEKDSLRKEVNLNVPVDRKVAELAKKDTIRGVITYSSAVQSAVENEYSDVEYAKPRSLQFKVRGNADAETAIVINDSIYGPANVSVGRGDLCEYDDQTHKKYKERNSAWFKFTIKKDTLLTFHIAPTLVTDDYDFALFKCDSYSCLSEIKRGKYKPIRYCFGWNTSHNSNTGLSNNGRDTTWQNSSYTDDVRWSGKTYAPALKVKAGETYYLMITISNIDYQNKDPEGFMIYFYRNLPKARANTYNPKYGQ